jgi:hypothetical protein
MRPDVRLNVADDRHVLRTVAGPEACEVLAEDHVQHPVQAVLHAPLRPHGTRECQSTQSERAQIITCLLLDLSVSLDLGFDPSDHGQVREHGLAWIMPVRCHPVDLMTDCVPAGLDPPCRQVHRLVRFERHVGVRIRSIRDRLRDFPLIACQQFRRVPVALRVT